MSVSKYIILFLYFSIVRCIAKEVTFVLNNHHVIDQWRHEIGREIGQISHSNLTSHHTTTGLLASPLPKKGLVWTRHKSIGIGNALCALVRVVEDSLMDDQRLFIRSIIIRKFCSLVNCSIHALPDDSELKNYTIEHTKMYQISLNGLEDVANMVPFHRPAKCHRRQPQHSKHGPKVGDMHYLSKKSSSTYFDEYYSTKELSRWCMFSTILRSLITGGKGFLLKEEMIQWLKTFYIGDPLIFDQVMTLRPSYSIPTTSNNADVIHDHAVNSGDGSNTANNNNNNHNNNNNNNNHNLPWFDVTIHLRTLDMIERHAQINGKNEVIEVSPQEAKEKEKLFVNSIYFENMIQCFVEKIGEVIIRQWKSEAILKNKTKTETTEEEGEGYVQDIQQEQKNGNVEESKTDSTSTQKLTNDNVALFANHRIVRIFLASDSSGLKPIFASQLEKRLHAYLTTANRLSSFTFFQQISDQQTSLSVGSFNHKEAAHKLSPSSSASHRQVVKEIIQEDNHLEVRVEYISSELPPAHFFLWLKSWNMMNDFDWKLLFGTLSEWFFLSQGRRLFAVKGIEGGSKVIPSSFALSAAGYGKAKEFSFLVASSNNNNNVSRKSVDDGGKTTKQRMVGSFASLKYGSRRRDELETNIVARNRQGGGGDYNAGLGQCEWELVASFD